MGEQSFPTGEDKTGNLSMNESADAWFKRGAAQFTQQCYREAIPCFDQTLKLNDAMTLAWVFRSASRFALEDYAAALPDAEQALALAKRATPIDEALLPRLLSLHAEILFWLGRYTDALGSFSELQRVRALTAYQWALLANTHRSLHHVQDAVAAYHQALAHPERGRLSDAAGTSSADWLNMAQFCFDAKAYDDALEATRLVVMTDSDNVVGWGVQAQALLELKRYDEALAAANRALELNDRYAAAWQVRARAYRTLKRVDEASDAYERVLDLLPIEHPEWQNVVAEEARMLLQNGRVKQSLSLLETQARRKIGKPRP